MSIEKYPPRDYYEIRSFFRDSWVEVPDRDSLSRTMRPLAVARTSEDPNKSHSSTRTKGGSHKDAEVPGKGVEEEEDRNVVGENMEADSKSRLKHAATEDACERASENLDDMENTPVAKPHQPVPASAIYVRV
jgi:hypothetical protein